MPHTIHKGKRGGSYYLTEKGRKVYVTNKPGQGDTDKTSKAGIRFLSKAKKNALYTDDERRLQRLNREHTTFEDEIHGYGGLAHGTYILSKATGMGPNARNSKQDRAMFAALVKQVDNQRGRKNGFVKSKNHNSEKDSNGNN
jgi:hypothetical protein